METGGTLCVIREYIIYYIYNRYLADQSRRPIPFGFMIFMWEGLLRGGIFKTKYAEHMMVSL